MELDLIVSLKRNMGKHRKEIEAQGLNYEQWQKIKLREMERYRKENSHIIGKYESAIEEKIAEELLENYKSSRKSINRKTNTIEPSIPGLNEELSEATKVGIELTFYRMNDKKLDSLIQVVNNDFKNANAAVLRRMDDVYRQTLFKAQVPYSTGNLTLAQAIDAATKDFLAKGIDAVTYKNGAQVNISSYVEMALRTSNVRANMMASGKRRQEIGNPLVLVPLHATACELCVPWQGKVLIDDVYSGGTIEDGPYSLLSVAMDAGLLHPQCHHTPDTFFPGINSFPDTVDENIVNENYVQKQRQRYIERQIRTYKRLESGSIDEVNQDVYKGKVREWQKIMREHLADNEQLRRSYRREKIY